MSEFEGIEHPDIGNVVRWESKDNYGKPIRGMKISLSRNGWLVYDEAGVRNLHRMLADMIAEWDVPPYSENKKGGGK